MTAENFNNPIMLPDFDFEIGLFTQIVEKAFTSSCQRFVNQVELIKNKNQFTELNENSLTQEFVAQLNRTLRILDLPICAGREYIDIHNINANIKRTVDFYFYSSEQDEATNSLYSVEAKRLPTPTKIREKEYVIGNDSNGGIERFKIEEHGKGLKECGVVGFVEEETFDKWYTSINLWIQELIDANSDWTIDEKLTKFQSTDIWAKSFSIVNRISKEKLQLFHFWIKTYSDSNSNSA